MIKKKVQNKAKTKTNAKKKSTNSKTDLNPADVRKEIAQMVDSQATTMAQAVIDEGKKGQLAPVKYLLELAKIFPAATDGSEATEDEDSLARTLLNRMGLPIVPIKREDEDDEPKAASCGEAGGKDAASEEECGEAAVAGV